MFRVLMKIIQIKVVNAMRYDKIMINLGGVPIKSVRVSERETNA